MSKPWDNEQTPTVDYWEKYDKANEVEIEYDHARSLEKRLRAAERLLAEYSFGIQSATELCEWLDKIEAHLAAGREDDSR